MGMCSCVWHVCVLHNVCRMAMLVSPLGGCRSKRKTPMLLLFVLPPGDASAAALGAEAPCSSALLQQPPPCV